MTSAWRPASSVREITESLRIDATVDGSAYSGAGSRMVSARKDIRAAAEDELGAGLVCGGRHGAVELDDGAAARHSRCQRGGHRDLFRTPRETENVGRCQPAHQQCGRGAADAGVRGGPTGRADVDAASGDDDLGEPEAQLEFAFLVGVQVVAQVRRHDDLDANQPLGLGARDQSARGRSGDPEPVGDLGLGQPVEVVEGRRAQCQSQVLGRGTTVPPSGYSPSTSTRHGPPFCSSVSKCSGVRVDAHHVSMVIVTHTTLSRATLDRVPIAKPTYEREEVGVGIVHFGVGGFHRAHQAMYVDQLLEKGVAGEWGICGVGVMPSDRKMNDVLDAQDGLYTLVLENPDGTRDARVIGSIVDYRYAPDDPESVDRAAGRTDHPDRLADHHRGRLQRRRASNPTT